MNLRDFVNGRTSGDGMEFVDTVRSDNSSSGKNPLAPNAGSIRKNIDDSTSRTSAIPGAMTIYRHDSESSKSVKLPVKVPQGKPFYLVPHLVNTKKSCSLKNKAPKFVPFEPYKAAVSISVRFASIRTFNQKKKNRLCFVNIEKKTRSIQ